MPDRFIRAWQFRGEREWLLRIREREGNWKKPFPKFGNGKGMEKIHSQSLGTGREWKKSIPKIREREGNEKNPFPKFGNGKGMKKSIPKVRERESEASILGNVREREFPLTPAGHAPSTWCAPWPPHQAPPPSHPWCPPWAVSRKSQEKCARKKGKKIGGGSCPPGKCFFGGVVNVRIWVW